MARRDPEFEALMEEVPPEVEEEAFHKDDPENPVKVIIVKDPDTPYHMYPEMDLQKPKPAHHRHSRLQTRKARCRAVRRANGLAKMWGWPIHPGYRDDLTSGFIHSYTSDRKPCSCDRCGHRRDWYGKTLQEKRIDDAEEVEDVGEPIEEIILEDFFEDEPSKRSTEEISEMALRYVYDMGDVGGFIEGYLDPTRIEDPELATLWHDAQFLIWEIKRKLGLERF